MFRKYGKTKSHGAGMQFDKLLKACSNSKKPAVTNTAGALGRFGIASFTSTRNSSFDNSDSCGEEESRFQSFKRPRFDVERNLASLRGDTFGYEGENKLITPQLPPTQNPLSIKPKKFFKSRNLDGDQDLGGTTEFLQQSIPQGRHHHLPSPKLHPLPLPITIPIPPVRDHRHDSKKAKPSKRKAHHHHKRKDADDSETDIKPDINLLIKTEPGNNGSSSSPSIKLRIFKDKKTSKFVSVSDTCLPPNLEPEGTSKDENSDTNAFTTKRGRKPKVEPTIESMTLSVAGQRRSGRLNPKATRLRSSDSISEMPILSVAAEDDEREADVDEEVELKPDPHLLTPKIESLDLSQGVQKIDSAESLVKRLEEEDSEFRELTAVLSSMEGNLENPQNETENSNMVEDVKPIVKIEPPEESLPDESSKDLPFQDSPVNYSLSYKSSSPPPAAISKRDLCSMLEEWDDDYEDDSQARKSTPSPNKVSRFEMPECVEPKYATELDSELLDGFGTNVQPNLCQHYTSPILPINQQQHLNSSYAVRNLLSEITRSDYGDVIPMTSTDSQSSMTSSQEKYEDNTLVSADESPIKSIPNSPLVTSLRKASFFKSRGGANTCSGTELPSPKKRLALYKHQFGTEKQEPLGSQVKQQGTSPDGGFEDDFIPSSESLSLRRQKRFDDQGIEQGGGKVYCSQDTKKLFTVVRNVKPIHELQESGEVHEFDGDIWYILEDLKESNPISSRCLSAITLGTRCMEPAFRMHLRAHGTVTEFSRALHDAPNTPVLALAAATVLFVLSQDRLNMDLDTESFQLILSLAKTEQSPEISEENPDLMKHKQRIVDLVSEMKSRGHAKHIKMDKITASELALETLLFLTSKRAGEWVKRELRTLGGLHFIVTEVEKALGRLEHSLLEWGWAECTIEILWKIDRCLKVLQQVTFNHEENQKYLLGLQSQPHHHQLPTTDCIAIPQNSPEIFVRLFSLLSRHLTCLLEDREVMVTLRDILFSVLRLLVNLTHDYRGIVLGSEILSDESDFLQLTLNSIFTLSNSFLDGKGFDLHIHSLCLLLNIVEHSRRNRELVVGMSVNIPSSSGEETIEQSTLDALIQMFFRKESQAKEEEASTDNILIHSTDKKESKVKCVNSSQESQFSSSQESVRDGETSSLQDIIDKLIETAGKHMENSMIAAYISLLIAYLVMDDQNWTTHVQNAMPNGRFLPLMILLKKLFNFMSITTSTAGSTRGLKATSIALNFFEKCDPESAAELKDIIPD